MAVLGGTTQGAGCAAIEPDGSTRVHGMLRTDNPMDDITAGVARPSDIS